tara:strand:- start:209 stop:505 length:297 start_codon:yes stop_codon:yes gene_type:complete
MDLINKEFKNSKGVDLIMAVSYERDKLKLNGDKTNNQFYVTFYKGNYMLSRYYMRTLLEGKNEGLCLEGSNPDKYFVDKKDMIEFRKVFKTINTIKGA